MPVDCGVLQDSTWELTFLMCINDLYKAVQYCIADDTNLFHTSKSVKNLNDVVNCDMKNLNN